MKRILRNSRIFHLVNIRTDIPESKIMLHIMPTWYIDFMDRYTRAKVFEIKGLN